MMRRRCRRPNVGSIGLDERSVSLARNLFAKAAGQPTRTESIEIDPPSTPSTGNATGSPR